MTPAEVRIRVKELCGYDSSASHPRLTNTVIDDLLFEAMLRAAQMALPRTLRSKNTQDLSDEVATYFAPSNFLEFIAVKSNGAVLRKAEQEDLDIVSPTWESATPSSVQQYFYVDELNTSAGGDYGKLKFGVWPAPDDDYSNGLVLRYVRKPMKVSEMASTSTEIIDIVSWTHDALCQYIAWRHLAGQIERPREDYAGYKAFFDQTMELYAAAEYVSLPYFARRQTLAQAAPNEGVAA